MTKRYICARCGNPVGYWFYGWKHQRGGASKTPSCGQKPVPKEVVAAPKESDAVRVAA